MFWLIPYLWHVCFLQRDCTVVVAFIAMVRHIYFSIWNNGSDLLFCIFESHISSFFLCPISSSYEHFFCHSIQSSWLYINQIGLFSKKIQPIPRGGIHISLLSSGAYFLIDLWNNAQNRIVSKREKTVGI